MVGYVTRFGHPRLSDDVRIDNMYVAEPLLPDTRSELTLPLRSGPKILGAMDIQSIQPAAFTQDDLIALQTLADQLATAIENMRLMTQVQTALSEAGLVIQDQSLENWERLFANQGILAYEYDLLEIRQITDPADALVKPNQAQNSDLASPATAERGWLQVSVKLRDQVLGTIILESRDPNHIWSQDEIAIVEATANQAALTVENARLLAESQSRARREQLISEVTGRLRSSLDMETVLKTAAQEIGQRLGIAQVEIQLSRDIERTSDNESIPVISPTSTEAPSAMLDGKPRNNGRMKNSSEFSSGQRSTNATD